MSSRNYSNILLLLIYFILPLKGTPQLHPEHKLTINSVKVDPTVLERKASIILTMTNNTESTLSSINSRKFKSDNAKAVEIVRALEAHAKLTQAPITKFLTILGVEFETFWISNQIHIKEGTPSLVLTLLDIFPATMVREIREEIVLPLLPTFDRTEGAKTQSIEWGVNDVGAPEAWKAGFFGQGIRVGIIDTGCRATHQDLAGRMDAFKDCILGLTIPYDSHGHGTHVTGTILGAGGVGVAPKATYCSCVACDAVACLEAPLIKCAEFMVCPDPGLCSKKPHVVSNSWGGSGGQTFYDSCINAWQSANIVPVFALGNSGPDCGSAGSPGDRPKVVGVAAVDKGHASASFSSKGPSTLGDSFKPDLSAPGVEINSCSHASDKGYTKMSGTSMACPHISGVVALLLCKDKGLTFTKISKILRETCKTTMTTSGATCSDISDNTFPNFIFGFGEASCAKALNAMDLDQANLEVEKE